MEWYTSMAKTICLLSALGNLPRCSSLWHLRSFNSEFEWWAASAIDGKDVIATHSSLSVLTRWSPLTIRSPTPSVYVVCLLRSLSFPDTLGICKLPSTFLHYHWTICIFSLNRFSILRVNPHLQISRDILSHVVISTCCCPLHHKFFWVKCVRLVCCQIYICNIIILVCRRIEYHLHTQMLLIVEEWCMCCLLISIGICNEKMSW